MMENPNSVLSKSPKPTFTSRYADPSHPANSGSLIALVTGGHVTRDHLPQRRVRRSSRGRGHEQGQRGLVGAVAAARSRQSPLQNAHGELDSEENQGDSGRTSLRDRRRSAREGALSTRNPRERLLGGGPIHGIGKLLKSVSFDDLDLTQCNANADSRMFCI